MSTLCLACLVSLAQGMTCAVKSASQVCKSKLPHTHVRRLPACDCRGLSPRTVHISPQAIMLPNVAVVASHPVVKV